MQAKGDLLMGGKGLRDQRRGLGNFEQAPVPAAHLQRLVVQ